MFTPTAAEVEILIEGETSGPTTQQRAFFDELQKRYGKRIDWKSKAESSFWWA
jgi:hypothetical protein